MKISQNGANLIKHFEGLELEAYRCDAGVLTIGYGHTKTVREGMVITEEKADQLFDGDIKWAENAVNAYVKVPINQNQFDALVSFTFNFGATRFRESTLLRLLNEGDELGAAGQFILWINSRGKPSNGLIRRRQAEQKLFITAV